MDGQRTYTEEESAIDNGGHSSCNWQDQRIQRISGGFFTYMERLEDQVAANNITEPNRNEGGELVRPDWQVSVLLTAIGAKAYGILYNVLTLAKPGEN